jgi:hypothetical protein
MGEPQPPVLAKYSPANTGGFIVGRGRWTLRCLTALLSLEQQTAGDSFGDINAPKLVVP